MGPLRVRVAVGVPRGPPPRHTWAHGTRATGCGGGPALGRRGAEGGRWAQGNVCGVTGLWGGRAIVLCGGHPALGGWGGGSVTGLCSDFREEWTPLLGGGGCWVGCGPRIGKGAQGTQVRGRCHEAVYAWRSWDCVVRPTRIGSAEMGGASSSSTTTRSVQCPSTSRDPHQRGGWGTPGVPKSAASFLRTTTANGPAEHRYEGGCGGLVWFGSTPPPDDQAHGQRNRPCATRLGWALPAVAVSRRAGLLTAPEPRGGTRGRAIPPCLCVWCAR